ncbi:alpha/beta hydrolase [Motilimonas eburnea]|nr:alpha/beta hydrolase [Motilimonas eburnea]
MEQTLLIDGASSHSGHSFILAHGAGAGMDHPFMTQMAQGIASHGIKVIRFNFPYMQRMLAEQRRLPPNKAPILLEAFEQVIAQVADGSVMIGGKSMGGRMASHLMHLPQVKGGVFLGFPFHPPGKPERLKGEHLADINKPCLLIQGERDTMGSKEEIAQYSLSPLIEMAFLTDGDHSFKPRKASGVSYQQNMAQAIELTAKFILSR